MRLCYVDEAGCTGTLPSATSEVQPVFAIAGLCLPLVRLHSLTHEFLDLKGRYYPDLVGSQPRLSWMPIEIKGADLRRHVAEGNRRNRRHSIGFLDRIIELLERYQARIVGRVWIKGIGDENKPQALYTSSMQSIFRYYQHYLGYAAEKGVAIMDSRNKHKNVNLAHSLFTQKFKHSGDEYSHILEMPTFGHSDNHAGIQLADLLCSSFLFPMAVLSYCTGHVTSVHVRPGYSRIKQRYGARLKRLQYRFQKPNGRWTGGIVVSDGIARRSGKYLFE